MPTIPVHRSPSSSTSSPPDGQAEMAVHYPISKFATEPQFLGHLYDCAPELLKAGDLARRFAALIRGDDDAGLDQWIEDATDSELASLAAGIGRDIAAVRAAITQPWSTSPVEGQINRLKTIKRQMYGRSGYPLLRNRMLAAA
ncbi:transposase [Mesorhizobium sp. AR07]|uniref:transposase n=1 Tax=Mesorhizobium sp. AR07 TaxID=2865838 RepID=UPI0039B6EA0D